MVLVNVYYSHLKVDKYEFNVKVTEVKKLIKGNCF